jgi:hypothetical protein
MIQENSLNKNFTEKVGKVNREKKKKNSGIGKEIKTFLKK